MRKKAKQNSGITLIALVITVLVIIILASIGLTSGISTVKSARFTEFTTEMKIMQIKLNELAGLYEDNAKIVLGSQTYVGKGNNEAGEIGIQDIGEALSDSQKQILTVPEVADILKEKGENNQTALDEIKKGFRYCSQNFINNSLEMGGITRDYLVNVKERILISAEAFSYQGTNYYMLEQMDDGLYNVNYNNQTQGKITNFTPKLETLGDEKWRITIQNIAYEDPNKNYINDRNLQVKYQIEGKNYSEATINDLSFIVTQPGTYKIKLVHGDEVTSVEKTLIIRSRKGNWDGTVNSPRLGEGMIPIKYDETQNSWVITNENDPEWYHYETENKKWANIMLSDGKYSTTKANEYQTDGTTKVETQELGSMFVWIPRYEYKLTYYTNANKTVESQTKTSYGKIDIHFIENTSRKNTEEENYRIHPAFTNDVDAGGWNKEITGLWVAKFETSMETNGTPTEVPNLSVGDVTTNDSIKAVSKPGRSSWCYISIGNSYTNGYEFNRANESHLVKNSEWGAAVYLTYSPLGINQKVADGDMTKAYAGGGTGNYYLEHQNQSSTGNMYGIYDLGGFAWDYTANFISSNNAKLSNYGNSFANLTKSNKYVTIYPGGEEQNADISKSYHGWANIHGDAIYETSTNVGPSPNHATGWEGSTSDEDSSDEPFFSRNNLFKFTDTPGGRMDTRTYRVTLVTD